MEIVGKEKVASLHTSRMTDHRAIVNLVLHATVYISLCQTTDNPSNAQTTIPIKFLKARYLYKLDSVSQALNLLHDSRKVNPFLMASEAFLANIYLDLNIAFESHQLVHLTTVITWEQHLTESLVPRESDCVCEI